MLVWYMQTYAGVPASLARILKQMAQRRAAQEGIADGAGARAQVPKFRDSLTFGDFSQDH